jgi:subtilisin-like proprotein convertase family protein
MKKLRILLCVLTFSILAAFCLSVSNNFLTHANESPRLPTNARKTSNLDSVLATTFTNASPITINDNSTATPYPSSISVSGLSGTIPSTSTAVMVTLNGFSHTFPNDVGIVLVGPTGAALLIQDGATDGTTGNPASNVTYTVSDSGATQLPSNTGLVNGTTYKPAAYFTGDSFPAPGPGTTYNSPAPAGTATFASTFGGTNPNGTWSLYIADFAAGDSGSISGGWTLTFDVPAATPTPTPIPTPVQHHTNADFDGDGKTDFAVVRATGSALTSEGTNIPRFIGARGRSLYDLNHPKSTNATSAIQEYWYVHGNGNNFFSFTAWGDGVPDRNLSADFDGDGKTDIAVWRSGTPSTAGFYIINSKDGTVRFQLFGQQGDDPSAIADYDGDGAADPAVFRCPSTPGPCAFYYMGTLNNPFNSITVVNWGDGIINNISPIPGDYDGDGKADFCVYREDPLIPGQGQYAIHKSNGSPDEFVDWGIIATDFIVPGDFDGDGKADFMVVRDNGGNYQHYLQTRSGQFALYTWGITNDVPVPGDYDGDGKTDVAVWRGSAVSDENRFYIINSHDGTVNFFTWGQCAVDPCDEPVADWQVH